MGGVGSKCLNISAKILDPLMTWTGDQELRVLNFKMLSPPYLQSQLSFEFLNQKAWAGGE